MNNRQKRKLRKKLYRDSIEDVALEISLDTAWRKRLLNLPHHEKAEITFRNLAEIPKYIQKNILLYKLEFWAMRIDACDEYFDKGLEVFAFQAKEFPTVIRYTGNNPMV